MSDFDVCNKKNRFIGQFIKLTREFGSKRSRSANIVISTYYLLLVITGNASVMSFLHYISAYGSGYGVYNSGASSVLFGTPRPLSPHDSLQINVFYR